jgi:hypothetical protein
MRDHEQTGGTRRHGVGKQEQRAYAMQNSKQALMPAWLTTDRGKLKSVVSQLKHANTTYRQIQQDEGNHKVLCVVMHAIDPIDEHRALHPSQIDAAPLTWCHEHAAFVLLREERPDVLQAGLWVGLQARRDGPALPVRVGPGVAYTQQACNPPGLQGVQSEGPNLCDIVHNTRE